MDSALAKVATARGFRRRWLPRTAMDSEGGSEWFIPSVSFTISGQCKDGDETSVAPSGGGFLGLPSRDACK